jgi:hypothetical protein
MEQEHFSKSQDDLDLLNACAEMVTTQVKLLPFNRAFGVPDKDFDRLGKLLYNGQTYLTDSELLIEHGIMNFQFQGVYVVRQSDLKNLPLRL